MRAHASKPLSLSIKQTIKVWTNSVIIVNKFISPEAKRPTFTLIIVRNEQCLGTTVNEEAAACVSYFSCVCSVFLHAQKCEK